MKNKRMSIYLFSFVVMCMFLVLKPNICYGVDAEVKTNGEIVFTESSTSPTTSTSSSTDKLVSKPKGKLPSTGELVQKSLVVCLIVLGLFAVILWWKKKNEKVEGGK